MISSPAVRDGTVYLATSDSGLVQAQKNGPTYTNADGTPNYRAAARDSFYDQLVIAHDRLMSVGAVLSTPVVDGDTIYFGSWDGQLYAIG